MSYSDDLGRQAKKAFVSPSTLAKRLGPRLSPRSRDSDDSHSVAASRRSISMIQSSEDAEIFEQMGVATGVRLKKSKKNPNASDSMASASAQMSLEVEETGSQIEEFIRGVNVAAVRLMQTLSPAATDSNTINPLDIPRLEAKDYEQEEEGGLWDFAGSGFLSFEDYGESKRSIPVAGGGDGSHSVSTLQRTPLDLHNNDNTFHVLANLIVEFLESKMSQDGKLIVLQPEDRVRMERVLPETVRLDFIDAVRTRLKKTPVHAGTPLEFITLQCQEFGLDREGRQNPILVAANLAGEPSFIPVCSNFMNNSHSMSFDQGLSFNPTPIVYEEDEVNSRESSNDENSNEEHNAPIITTTPTPDEAETEAPLSAEKNSINTSLSGRARSVNAMLIHPEEAELVNEPVEKTELKSGEDERQGSCDNDDEDEEHQGGDTVPDMAGSYQRYNHSMLSTMSTVEEDEDQHGKGKEEHHTSGAGFYGESPESHDLTPLGVEMTFSETMKSEGNALGDGSADSHSGTEIKSLSKSTSGSLSSKLKLLPPADSLPMRGSNVEEHYGKDSEIKAASYESGEEQQRGKEEKDLAIPVVIPSHENPTMAGLQSVQSPAISSEVQSSPQSSPIVETGVQSAQSHSNTTGYGYTVESPTMTLAPPTSEIQSDAPWEASEKEVKPSWQATEREQSQFHLSDETPLEPRSPPPDVVTLGDETDAEPSFRRPPPHPESSARPTTSTSQFWQVPLSYADQMSPVITSMFSASNTVDSGTTTYNINPFSSLAIHGRPFAGSPTSESQPFAPSPVSEVRSELYEQLEQKKRDLALKAQLSNDYGQYEQSIVTPHSEARETLRSDPESLARQQIMAEQREALTFVDESENPEIAKFWKDHVQHLKNRLRALEGEEIDVSEASVAEINESNRRLISAIVHRQQYLPDEYFSSPTPPPDAGPPPSDTNQKELETKLSQDDAQPALPPEVEDPPEVSGGETASLVFVTSDAAPPTDVGITSGFFSSENQTFATQQKSINEDSNALEPLPQPHSAHDEHSAAAALPEPNYELPMVDVVAPADLPGGYHFEAEIEGKRFLATVPAGGVQQGETFTCYMRDLDSVAIDIPVGYWKDNLSKLLDYGCCHPVVWNSIFCPLIALGQVQHRVGFDFLGRVIIKDKDSSSSESPLANRTMMMAIIASWAFMNIGIYLGYNWKWSRGLGLTMADISAMILVNIMMYGFVVFVTQSTRSSLREKFLIREQRCNDLEDICCATMCLPCTVAQMSRHTANYDDYEAVCCSKTGLPDGVRVNQSQRDHGSYIV